MGNKQSNKEIDELDLDAIKSQNIKSKMQIRGIQSLFSSVYVKIQETLTEMKQVKEQNDFVQMENIDLFQALNGTVFKTNLVQLCDIKLITNNIKARFDELQCDHCNQQAKIASECNQESSYNLYCEYHFKKFGFHIKNPIILKYSKKLFKIILGELERHLIHVQARIDYFHIENNKKDPILFENVKGLIEEDFEELKVLLESLTSNCLKINQMKAKTIKLKFEDLSFIKDDCDKCRSTIFKILSMIPQVCDKIESDSFAQVIVNSQEGVSLEEEIKEDTTSLVSDNIYGKEYQLIHIPMQSLTSFKKIEEKIKNNCKFTEKCIEKVKILMDTAEELKKMLEQKLDDLEKMIIKDKEKVLEQLRLRDAQFYIDKFRLKSDDAEYFKYKFATLSDVYKRLGQFDYGQPNCTADHSTMCIQTDYNWPWIYIGEVKEGTYDTPHGIGIRVWYDGAIEDGYWEDGKLHGRGRDIDWNGEYYIGEFKEGGYNGEGTYYTKNDDKYTGKWDKYKGQGEVNYKDGTKYTGQWDGDRNDYKYKRHGLGTLYSAAGQVLNQGKWEWDEYKGKE